MKGKLVVKKFSIGHNGESWYSDNVPCFCTYAF